MKATIITIGDELLIGQVIDTNSAYIAQELSALGIGIYRRIAISDQLEEIQMSIREAWSRYPIVITTGGLGPTKDDITKKAIADMFGVGFRRDERTYQHVKAFFESRNVPFLPVNAAQADVPENAEILFNARGTAPAMWFDLNGKILISLPGVPYEMEYLIQTHVLVKLREKFQLPSLYYSYIQTCGLGESFLAKKIAHIEDNLPPEISLAYLPSPMTVNLRLSGTQIYKEEIEHYTTEISSELSEYVYDHTPWPVEQLVLKKMLDLDKKMCLVESCTGGYISHLLTNMSGASQILYGGWTVYTNNFKNKELGISHQLLAEYSAVSEVCVRELLVAAFEKSVSDFGIAVVGYLEKFENEKPHAYIAYGTSKDIRIKKIDLFYPRAKSKEAIARVALVGLYRDFLN